MSANNAKDRDAPFLAPSFSAAVAAVAILLASCTRYSYTYVKGSEVEYEQVDSLNISRIKR
jgi:outer membrane protein assembly factor BamE (lipoprotein component of BamABCDE complex)